MPVTTRRHRQAECAAEEAPEQQRASQAAEVQLAAQADSIVVEETAPIDEDKSDSEAELEGKTERLCASHARAEYGLTEKHLKELKYENQRNPHYKYAAPMRLYIRREVFQLARRLHKEEQYKKEHAEETAEAAAMAARAEREKAAATARSRISGFKRQKLELADSGLPLAWTLVMSRALVKDIDPAQDPTLGFTSVSVGARRIANLAMTCKEMRNLCSVSAWPMLAIHVSRVAWEPLKAKTTEDGRLAPVWDTVLADPTSCKLSELQDAARQVQVKQSGTKAELILRLLHFLGVPEPLSIPAAILFCMRFEKSQPCTFERTGAVIVYNSQVVKTWQCNSLFNMRRLLEQDHKCVDEASYEALKFACEAKWQEERVRSMQRAREGQVPGNCRCGNNPSPRCIDHCCKRCCSQPGCPRHRRSYQESEVSQGVLGWKL